MHTTGPIDQQSAATPPIQQAEKKESIDEVFNRRWAEICKAAGYSPNDAYIENRDYLLDKIRKSSHFSIQEIDAALGELAASIPMLFNFSRRTETESFDPFHCILFAQRMVEEYLLKDKKFNESDLQTVAKAVREMHWSKAMTLTKPALLQKGLCYQHLADFKAWDNRYSYGMALEALLSNKNAWFTSPEAALKYLGECSKLEVYFLSQHGDYRRLPSHENTRLLLEEAWFAPFYYDCLHEFATRQQLEGLQEFGNEFATQVLQILKQLTPDHRSNIESWCFSVAYHGGTFYDKTMIPEKIDQARREAASKQKASDLPTTRVTSHMYPPPCNNGKDLVFSPEFKKAMDERGHVVLVGSDSFLKRKPAR